MKQTLFCPSCGRGLFDVSDTIDVSKLRELVEQAPRCECGVKPYVYGVRFE